MSFIVLLVFMALMIALLIFIRWDRRQPAKSISREQISKGFIPGGNAKKWLGFFGIALAAFSMALHEFINPSIPPFTGKTSTMKTFAYETLGTQGNACLWLLIGAAFVVAACLSYHSSSHRKPDAA